MLSTMQDGPLSIATLVRYGTSVHGDSEVVTWTGDSGRRASFAEIGREAARLANALRALGVTGDDRVGTFMWNNAEHFAVYLAVPGMGAVLHTLNLRLFPEQLTYIVNHAQDKVIVADASLLPLLNPLLSTFDSLRHVIVVGGEPSAVDAPEGVEVHGYADLLAAQPDEFDWVEIDERSAAAMCYTSGTTGNPKGVVYSHRSIWLHSMQVCMTDGMSLAQSDRALLIVPMFHAMSWGLPYASVMVGASVIMPDHFLQPAPLAAIMAAEQPTLAGAVPTIWSGLLSYLDQHPQDLSSLRNVVVGGSACPPSLMRAFNDRYGVHITHAWGMTETSPLGSLAHPPVWAKGEDEWNYRFSQGRLPASVQGRLIGTDGEEAPWDGESVGELEVRGPWVAAGYYGVDDPEKFHDGWLRTGDVGTLTHDGFLRLTDRSKDVIKSGGEWISSIDLENLAVGHPAVAEAAVIGVHHPKWDERPLLIVQLKAEQSATREDILRFMDGKIAKWWMPDDIVFVDGIPHTATGKILKTALRDQFKAYSFPNAAA